MCTVTTLQSVSQSALPKSDRTVDFVSHSVQNLCGSIGLPTGRYWEFCISAVKRKVSELCLLLMLRMPGAVPPRSKHINALGAI